jgi:hypothetical protein
MGQPKTRSFVLCWSQPIRGHLICVVDTWSDKFSLPDFTRPRLGTSRVLLKGSTLQLFEHIPCDCSFARSVCSNNIHSAHSSSSRRIVNDNKRAGISIETSSMKLHYRENNIQLHRGTCSATFCSYVCAELSVQVLDTLSNSVPVQPFDNVSLSARFAKGLCSGF